MTTGHIGAANADLSVLLKRNRRDADAHFIAGLGRLLPGSGHLAVRSFTDAIRADRSHVDAYRGRAWASLQQGKLGDAVRDFSEVLRLAPSDSDAYRGRGWAQLFEGNYVGAMTDFAALVDRAGFSSEVYAARGLALYLSGKPEGRNDIEAALMAPPANGAMQINNVAFDDHERLRKVQALLERQGNRDRSPAPWLVLAAVHHAAGNGSGSNAAFTRALAVDPNAVDVWMSRAKAAHAAGRYGESLRHLQQIIQLQPDNAEAHFRSALANAGFWRWELANTHCGRASELLPADPVIGEACTRITQMAAVQRQAAAERAARASDSSEAAAMAAVATGLLLLLGNSGGADTRPGGNAWLYQWGYHLTERRR